MDRPTRQDIDEGNFDDTDEIKRGEWKVGHFAEKPHFRTNDTEFQYVYKLDAGKSKPSTVYYRNCSTLTVLIEGKIEISFPHSKSHPKVVLSKPGAYNFFGPNVCHSWKAIEDTKLVGVRWPSIPDDGIECDHNY